MATGKGIALLLGLMVIYVICIVNAAVMPTVSRDTGSERRRWDWVPHGNFCYQAVPTPMAWGKAEVYCRGLEPGAHLASIHSLDESTYLNNMVKLSTPSDTRQFWIGASVNRTTGHFEWKDGTVLDYQGLSAIPTANTDDHCVFSYLNVLEPWGVANCDRKLSFVCKFRIKDTVTNSILLLCPNQVKKQAQPEKAP